MTIPVAERSACIEMLFRDHSDHAARIHAAKAAGYGAIEFWNWSDKDLPGLRRALNETGLAVAGLCAEPNIPLNDPANHTEFLAALPRSIAVAQDLGSPNLYVQGGVLIKGASRSTQTTDLTRVLALAADVLKGSGVTLLLEAVSDTDNCFLTHAAEGFPIVATVNRPEVRLLYDLFHAAVAGEDLRTTAQGRVSLIGHVHVADHPGRGAPGTGTLNLAADMEWLRAQGYLGRFGMEFLP